MISRSVHWSLRLIALVASLLAAVAISAAPAKFEGSVAGTVVDSASHHPVELVAVTLKQPDGKSVQSAMTDHRGEFAFEKVPAGEYVVSYNPVGSDAKTTAPFTVDAAHAKRDLGNLNVADPTVKMEKVEVSAHKDAFYNSIDRKVYNVGKDIQSSTGSASDLLQNIPSVQVDVEGNVSLRGNDNVLILINGKTSALMSTTNRGDVLEQMSADSIEKIEVITNPSAKYKPDGTAGIINIALKKKREPGYSGVIRASVGNDSRYNVGLTGNYRPPKFNLFGTVSLRQDDRLRFTDDQSVQIDPATKTATTVEQKTVEHMRPLSRLAQTGFEFDIDDANKVGATVDYNLRTFFRTATETNTAHNAAGALTSDYDRVRTDPEWQKTLSFTSTWQHTFPTEGHELDVEFKHEWHQEQEDNHYADNYRTPAAASTYDYTTIKPTETGTELTADYTRALADDAKLDAGYSLEVDKNDMDFHGGNIDAVSRIATIDFNKTNRFIYIDHIDAIYATYGRPIGKFGFLAGLRFEDSTVDTNQVTTKVVGKTGYVRLYPTLHLSYNLTETGQLQLNYSHRIHRPESDDLNPFPEYQDPSNLRAGNPHLIPEETHSIESGYQYKKDETTYLAALYFRQTYHAFTTITQYVDPVTLVPSNTVTNTRLTTHQNLSSNRSGGLELAATRDLGPVSLNFSANVYQNQIDASNLGFSSSRTTVAWDAKLNAIYHASKTTQFQFNTNYTATRLTPQGERRPTYIANLGMRHDLKDKKTAVVVTVSDLFDSLKERTIIDTPTLHDDVTRRRSSRIIYVGFVYNFGKPTKKSKDDSMKFDNSL